MAYLRAAGEKALNEGNAQEAKEIYHQLWLKERRAKDLIQTLKILNNAKDYNSAYSIIKELPIEAFKIRDVSLYSSSILRQSGNYQESIKLLSQSLEWNPTDAELSIEIARNFTANSQYEDAIKALESIKNKNTNNFSMWFNLGVAYSNIGRIDEGLEAFTNANIINPEDEVAAANRIVLLKETRQIKEARKALDNLPKKINRKRVEILGAEAGVLMAEQEFGAAAIILKDLCEKNPLQSTNWLNYVACIKASKVAIDPDSILRTALKLNPNDSSLKHSWLQSLCELGKQKQAKALLSKLSIDDFMRKDLHLFNLLFLSTTNQLLPSNKLKEIVSLWENAQKNQYMTELYKEHIHEDYTRSKRRIKVGYLSSDYCNHPVARFLKPILENHNKLVVETWAIHTGPNWDDTTEEIKSACDHWIELTNYDDKKASRIIADQRLDILVELGGFTGNNRITVCINEPAYIQMSYLGYPAPTYLNSIPWWIGDKYLFQGLKAEEANSHQLAYLEKGYMTLPRPANCPSPNRIDSSRVRFGSLNHARKITEETISLWCEILKRCKDSELILKSISFKHIKEQMGMIKRFEKYNIPRERLILLPYQDTFKSHLETYNRIDIALDPIPYGGATTTAEALWMGVPVICKKGEAMASNLAASVVASANCQKYIAKNKSDYIKIAEKTYMDGPRTNTKRFDFIEKVKNSPLNQPRRVSENLENIYKAALVSKEETLSA